MSIAPIGERIRIAPEVSQAIAAGAPVVALETTIVSHGMPYPDNVATALAVEAEVRAAGATPASIAVLAGEIRIGLAADEIEKLGRATEVLKLSRNDLAYALAARRDGATTVAATMICAHLGGIRIFATGGIGGVHRGAEASFDISADLEELARTPVAVVSAGAKALLDLPKTLEYLETHGVPVVGYGTDDFPAFWSRSSGLPAPLRLDSAAEIAGLLRTHWSLGLAGGVVIANPPPEAAAIPKQETDRWIESATLDAAHRGVSGKAVTPFLLARIFELSGGRSLAANIALVKSNARLAAAVAGELGANLQ